MQASKIYTQLEKDFIKPEFEEDWSDRVDTIQKFITNNFKKRSMGLVCDFTQQINKVYTAVFPSHKVMQAILNKKETDIMLFLHHPAIWDLYAPPKAFRQINRELLQQFKKRRISIYALHVPLDHYSEYSTSGTLAKALEVKIQKPFGPYRGSLCGVFGTTDIQSVQELRKKYQSLIGHKASLYQYGTNAIKNQKVALVGGGGNKVEFIKELVKEGVNTFVTGVTVLNEYSEETHNYAKKNKINILGGTHYSSEKFACIAMCEYFRKLGLPSEFIEGEPMLGDL